MNDTPPEPRLVGSVEPRTIGDYTIRTVDMIMKALGKHKHYVDSTYVLADHTLIVRVTIDNWGPQIKVEPEELMLPDEELKALIELRVKRTLDLLAKVIIRGDIFMADWKQQPTSVEDAAKIVDTKIQEQLDQYDWLELFADPQKNYPVIVRILKIKGAELATCIIIDQFDRYHVKAEGIIESRIKSAVDALAGVQDPEQRSDT